MAGKFEGLTFVFTGTLSHFTRNEAEKLVTDLGGRVSSSASYRTSYVVAGEAPGSKLTKAQSLGIPVLTEDEWLAVVRDYVTVKLYMKVKKESDWAEFRQLDPKKYGIPFTAQELFHGDDGTPTERQVSFPSQWDHVCRFIERCSKCSGRSFVMACHMKDGDFCCTSRNPQNIQDKQYIGYESKWRTTIRFRVSHPDSVSLAKVQSIFEEAGVRLSEEQKLYLAGFDGENFAFAREGLTDVDGVLIWDDTVMCFAGNVGSRAVIPDGIRRIRPFAFHETGIETVELPETLVEIGPAAFSDCSSLREITLPESVEKIGEWAFDGCTSLTEIHLPAKTALSKDTFQGCDALEKICLVGELNAQKSGNEESVLWGRYKNIRGKYKTVEIPETVRSIEAPDVPYPSFIRKFQTLALIGFIEAYMRGEDVKEELKDAYFEAIRKKGRFSQYLDHPLIIRFLILEKWIKLSQLDELTEASVQAGHVEITAMLMEYKHSAFSEKEIQREELRKQRKSERELERILGS